MNGTLKDIVIGLSGALVGLIPFFVERRKNRGKLSVENVICEIEYSGIQGLNTIHQFRVHVQFVNTSGYNKIVKNIQAHFHYGEEVKELGFQGHLNNPAVVVTAKSPLDSKLETIYNADRDIPLPVFEIAEGEAYLLLTMNIDGMLSSISVNDFRLIEVNRPVRIFAEG